MRIKDGVELNGLHFLLWYVAAVADWSHQANGWGEATISGGREGADVIGPARVGSAHGQGQALDIRFWQVPAHRRQAWAFQLQQLLGPGFRVVLESDHVHVELGELVSV